MKKNFQNLLLIISVCLLLYTFYRSEIIFSGSKRNYYYLYFLIFSITTLISISLFFLSNKIKILFIISLTSILISLYIFEGYITFVVGTVGDLQQKKLKFIKTNMARSTIQEINFRFIKI